MKSIFVSSTFKDMQAERNLIHFQIMPEINKFLKDYNQTIEFTDLRWGIDTTDYLNSSKKQEGEEKVLKICLEEIQKTPYFIVILGERYGWVPDDKDIIEHVIDILNTEKKQNYKLQDNKISVTHLEIDYGAFFRKHPENCLFYFREPLPQNKMKNHRIRLQNGEEVPVKEIYISQNFKERRRLENLKKEIEKEFPGRVKTYSADFDEKTLEVTGLDDFKNQIISDVKEMFVRDFEKQEASYWQQREEREIQYLINKKTEKFTGQAQILEKIDDFIEKETENNILLLTGEAGTGKSTISSRVYQIYKEKYFVIPFFMDNTEHSMESRDILLYQIYQLYKILAQETKGIQEMFKRYLEEGNRLLKFEYNDKFDAWGIQEKKYNVAISELDIKYLKENIEGILQLFEKKHKKKVIFIIDAIDQMHLMEEEKGYEWILDNLGSNAKYIITCLQENILAEESLPHMQKEKIMPLTTEDVKEVIEYYNKYSTQKVSQIVIEKILKKESITNFLYLTLLLQRFSMFGKYDYEQIQIFGNDMKAINKHMINIVENMPNDLKGACVYVLEYANKIFPTKIFHAILGLIANSRYGLREKDIEAIFKANNIRYNTVTFKMILNFLSDYFAIREDERIDFSHRIIKEAMRDKYDNKLFINQTMKTYNRIIIDYLLTLPIEDMLCNNEIIFHLWKESKQINAKNEALTNTLIIILESIISKNSEIINTIAREVWKLFRIDPKWLENIQAKLNVENMEIYAEFLLTYFREVMQENAYNHQIYVELLKKWETLLNSLLNKIENSQTIISEKEESSTLSDKQNLIKEKVHGILLLTWGYIYQYTKEKDEEIEYTNKRIEHMTQDEDVTLYSQTYTIHYDKIKNERIDRVGKNDIKWHKERLKWIEEQLKEETKYSDTYNELLEKKAKTYYYLNDNPNYQETMIELLQYHKNKVYEQEKTFENYKNYFWFVYDYYTIFEYEFLKKQDVEFDDKIELFEKNYIYSNKNEISSRQINFDILNKSDLEKMEDLIQLTHEILNFTKEQLKFKKDENSKLDLANAYVLVGNVYKIGIYVERPLQSGTKTTSTITSNGVQSVTEPVFVTVRDLKLYNIKKAGKYYKSAKEILDDFLLEFPENEKAKKLRIEVEAKIEKVKEDEEIKYQDNNITLEKMKKIEILRNKAIDTLTYENIKDYFYSLPKLDRIYNVKMYENVEKLYDIYKKAENFIEDYNDKTLFTEEQSEYIDEKLEEIHKTVLDLSIAKNGIEKFIHLVEKQYRKNYQEIFYYRKYQYLSEKTMERKKKIIDQIKKFYENEEKSIKEEYKGEELEQRIRKLYEAKREICYEMIEVEDLLSQKLLLEEQVENDLHFVNDCCEYYRFIDLISTLEGKEKYITILIKEYMQNKDESLLKNIYQEQDYFVTDCNTICKMVDEQFLYEKAIKNIEEIINFQKETRYLEKIEEYQNTLGKLKEELKNFCN